MTDNTQSEIYTESNTNALSPEDALRRLYSYNESTGPDVGGVIDLLSDTPAGVRADGLIEQINDNSEKFTAPHKDSDKHFTDIIGMASDAIAQNNHEKAVELLDETIIGLLEDTVDVFATVEQQTEEHHAFDQNVVDEIAYVRSSYEHMLELATTTKTKLSTGEMEE